MFEHGVLTQTLQGAQSFLAYYLSKMSHFKTHLDLGIWDKNADL